MKQNGFGMKIRKVWGRSGFYTPLLRLNNLSIHEKP